MRINSAFLLAALGLAICAAGLPVGTNHVIAKDANSIAAGPLVELTKENAVALDLIHPDSQGAGWEDLFASDLSNAQFPEGIWTVEDGVLTASKDKVIWTKRDDYENFTIDLEFKNASGTNSGVIVYGTSLQKWPANSVEIQIADDFHEKWANSRKNYQCGAIFGHVNPFVSTVNKPGEWNKMTAYCRGQNIVVLINGKMVSTMNMAEFSSTEKNPDGSKVPDWLDIPKKDMATQGRIGFQGKHGGVPIYFRNIKILEHDKKSAEAETPEGE